MSLERVLHFGDLRFAPEEARRLGAQIPWTRVERLQWWKVGAQTWGAHLKHTDRHGDIPQPSRPQINEIHSAEQNCCRIGQQHLTAVPGGHHSRSTIEHRTEVVTLP